MVLPFFCLTCPHDCQFNCGIKRRNLRATSTAYSYDESQQVFLGAGFFPLSLLVID
jgi:hypothetical protein